MLTAAPPSALRSIDVDIADLEEEPHIIAGPSHVAAKKPIVSHKPTRYRKPINHQNDDKFMEEPDWDSLDTIESPPPTHLNTPSPTHLSNDLLKVEALRQAAGIPVSERRWGPILKSNTPFVGFKPRTTAPILTQPPASLRQSARVITSCEPLSSRDGATKADPELADEDEDDGGLEVMPPGGMYTGNRDLWPIPEEAYVEDEDDAALMESRVIPDHGAEGVQGGSEELTPGADIGLGDAMECDRGETAGRGEPRDVTVTVMTGGGAGI